MGLTKGLLYLPKDLLGDKDGEIYRGRAFNAIPIDQYWAIGTPVDPKLGYPKKDTIQTFSQKRYFRKRNKS